MCWWCSWISPSCRDRVSWGHMVSFVGGCFFLIFLSVFGVFVGAVPIRGPWDVSSEIQFRFGVSVGGAVGFLPPWSRRVYFVRDILFSFFLVCHRIPGCSGVIWGCRPIFPSSREVGSEGLVLYLVWECFFRFSLVFYRIPEGAGGPWCRRGIIFRSAQSGCQVGVRFVIWECDFFRSLSSVV